MRISACDKILETYSLDEILELNELTEVDLLHYAVEEGFLELPENLPVDL